MRGEISGVDAKRRDVEQILAARHVRIKARDRVVAEPSCEHEGIVAGTAVHRVVAAAANQPVVACAAVKRVDTGAADQRVVTTAAAQAVVAGAAGNDVVQAVAGAAEGPLSR